MVFLGININFRHTYTKCLKLGVIRLNVLRFYMDEDFLIFPSLTKKNYI